VRSTLALEQAIRLVFGTLPAAARERLAGPPIVVDGARLDPDLQLLLRLERMTSAGTPAAAVDRRREHLDVATALVGGPPPAGVDSRALVLDRGTHAPALAARLYRPDGLPAGSPLLVYLHGGGWVTGSLNSHDTVCRFLARTAQVRVLAVAYRLAPEHRFPAAVVDAVDGLRIARARAAALGADPGAIALGGDSAGANLAAVAAHLAVRSGEAGPDRLLLFYPPCAVIGRTASRTQFGEGFLLTDADIVWFRDHYLPSTQVYDDPRASILLADDLTGMPPTQLITAGFDPLRDEGEQFGQRLAQAGVPVSIRREPDLVHGFVNMIGLSARCRAAVADAATALRQSFAGEASDRWCPR
jgi:acetyl esterase